MAAQGGGEATCSRWAERTGGAERRRRRRRPTAPLRAWFAACSACRQREQRADRPQTAQGARHACRFTPAQQTAANTALQSDQGPEKRVPRPAQRSGEAAAPNSGSGGSAAPHLTLPSSRRPSRKMAVFMVRGRSGSRCEQRESGEAAGGGAPKCARRSVPSVNGSMPSSTEQGRTGLNSA